MADLDRGEGAGLYGDSPEAYERGRLQYPDRVYELLAERGVGRGARVVEVGPATGLVTRRLLDSGAEVVGVEPNHALAVALGDRLAGEGLVVANDTFEDVDLPSGEYDAVIAATAFHWVDPSVGHRRAWNVLKPGGALIYWWMLFEDPWSHDDFDVASHRVLGGSPTVPTTGTLPFQVDTNLHIDRIAEAGFGDVRAEIFSSPYRLDTEAVVALYATIAVVLRRPRPEQQRVLDELAALVEDQFGGVVERRFVTAAYSGSRPQAE